MANNPIVAQGTLNRVRCSIIVPNYTSLNITAPYMGKSFATIDFEGNFDEQIETATGAVTSPEPYVMATITVGILRTQSLASSWLTQAQTTSDLGEIVINSDTAAFPSITLSAAVIRSLEPGAYDGMDPVSRLTLRGVFYINNDLWNLV